jgi:hypothetical protein
MATTITLQSSSGDRMASRSRKAALLRPKGSTLRRSTETCSQLLHSHRAMARPVRIHERPNQSRPPAGSVQERRVAVQLVMPVTGA